MNESMKINNTLFFVFMIHFSPKTVSRLDSPSPHGSARVRIGRHYLTPDPAKSIIFFTSFGRCSQVVEKDLC